MLFAILVGALQAAVPLHPEAVASAPDYVVRPAWVRQPRVSDLVRAFPAAAVRQDTSGRTIAECVVARDGALEQCEVVLDEPQDLGFDRAALKLLKHFRMRSEDLDGAPTVGRRVRLPIFFRLPVSVRARPVAVQSARFAGRSADVDCRLDEGVLDNCLAVASEPYDPELWREATAAATGLQLQASGIPRTRVRVRLEFAPAEE